MSLILKPRWQSLVAATLAVIVCGRSALADDSEIFTGSASAGALPNILLILDTSGSMASQVITQAAYDPATNYAGSCSSTLVYFQASGGSTPTGCSGMSSFSTTYQKCQSAVSSLANPGFYTDQFLQWKFKSPKYSWTNSISNAAGRYEVACQGDYSNNTAPYPTTYNGPIAANEWTNTAASSYWASGTGASETLYSANYLNYLASNPPVVAGTRISVVQQAATNLINSLSNVNIGLMRYSDNLSAPVGPPDPGNALDGYAAGGMVAYAISPVATNKAALVSTLNSYSPGGLTPLSETLYEAYLYYSGGNVLFGNTSVAAGKSSPSVAASRVGGSAGSNQYQTPIQYQCQKNFIVYLTDGLPTADNQADSLITALPNEATVGGACDDTTKSPYNGKDANGNAIPGGWGFPGPSGTDGKCMSALAKYMFNTDLSSSMAGQQNVQLYTIGFGDDPALAVASSWLAKAATAGGGQFYQTGDLNGLQTALTNIVSNILKTSTTFTAPTVSVNAFNRTQTLNDLYVSVFQPSLTYHWPGNVKKYGVQNGVIVDQNTVAAVDPTTGFFKNSAQSFWSASSDGSTVTAGGAASQIPDWNPANAGARKLYTYIGTNSPANPVDLTSSGSYAVTTTNALITNAILGVATTTSHDNTINYARGEDLKDENANGIKTEPRYAMGDPLHSQPAVVIYGGTTASPNINDAAILAATNDGYLHAFDVTNGHELWAFIPQELLGDLNSMYTNSPTSPKHYELDGSIRILKYDINGDGIVDPAAGDRVIAYFGNGRGGSMYYAVDVTSKTTPKFLWGIGPATTGLTGIGQTWSTPAITRVNIQGGGTQNSQKFVLVFGGGYDSAEEGTSYQTSDSSGNWIYMVDALHGTVLWSAGPTGASPGPNLALSRMDHAIPSDIAVLDIDGDGYADRMYVGDMAGQLWRFDITNGSNANNLVAGGVIASLGSHDDSPHTVAAARRFYNPPDVAAVAKRGTSPYFNIAIGSGYRGHPLNGSGCTPNCATTTIQDRFYAIRDYHPFDKLTQAQYNALTVTHDSDANLIDITSSVTPTIPAGALGWKLTLNQPGNSWVGEKVLAASSTFSNQVLFTTYTPAASVSSNPCTPGGGTNRIYAVSVFDGSPVANLNNQNNLSITDRYTTLAQGGIAPGVTFLFPAPQAGANGSPPPLNQEPVTCLSGAEVLGVCHNFNSRLKTVWSEQDAN
jgi:type IV pilus assembly protein PilY1